MLKGNSYLLKTWFVISLTLTLFSAYAEEVIPSKDQIVQNKGISSIKDGIRTQTQEEGSSRTVFSIYKIPFVEGTISFSWKVDEEQTVLVLIDGKPNGKGTHNLMIKFNGGHRKDNKIDRLGITTFDGSTKARKRFKPHSFDHHAKPGQWHKTSISIEANQVRVVVNDKTFSVTSDKLRGGSRRFCIGHTIGSLHIKEMKLIKIK